MAKNTPGTKNTVSYPGYPVSGPPAREGQPGPTPMTVIGPTPGSPGGGPDVSGNTSNEPKHPATGRTQSEGPATRHGVHHSQPKHPAER